MEETTYDLAPARKMFSRIGLSLSAIIVIATLVQLAWVYLSRLIWGEDNWLTTTSWGMWLGSFAPLYVAAIPAGLLILRSLPAEAPADHKFSAKSFLVIVPICYFLIYTGNLIGTFLSLLLSGGTAQNAVSNMAMDDNPLKILVMVILAPLLEELVFRKQLIDRTHKYGEKVAVLLSAITFGAIHQNLFQFFYAFALGLVFGYIYVRSGRLRYTVILHSVVNFMGAVVAPWILSLMDLEAMTNIDPNATPEELMALYSQILPGLLVFLLYAMLLGGLSLAGLVLLIVLRKKITWQPTATPLPQGTHFKTVYLNVGMILFLLLCLVSFVLALF